MLGCVLSETHDGQNGGQMPGYGQDGQTMPYGQGGQGWGDNGASPHGWDQDGDQGNGQQGQPYAPSATPYPSATPLSQ